MIDHLRPSFGVEPVCRELDLSASAYRARKTRPPSARFQRDQDTLARIKRIHDTSMGTYGAHRIYKQLRREGQQAARCTVERLMREHGIEGVARGRKRKTTIPDKAAARPADLVNRQFTADRPDQLWVADITYVDTWEGWVYVAFVTDVYSRKIIGWKLDTHLRTGLALDALEMAIRMRKPAPGALIHHSDRGCQYTSIRYSERLAVAGIAPSVGSVADSYDNALAEALNGTFKAELIDRFTWHTRTEAEDATTRWIGWYNNERIHTSIGDIPPAEYEAAYYPATITPKAA